MKKFKYRLESLLKVKEHIEREKQKVHARAMQGVQDQQAALCQIDNQRSETIKDQRQVLCGKVSLAEALVYTRYLLKLKRDTLQGAELLSGLERNAEEKRLELVEVSKEKRMHEKLKEKLEERHLFDQRGVERKEADETATTCFIRNRASS